MLDGGIWEIWGIYMGDMGDMEEWRMENGEWRKNEQKDKKKNHMKKIQKIPIAVDIFLKLCISDNGTHTAYKSVVVDLGIAKVDSNRPKSNEH